MGIKYFYSWYKNHFHDSISTKTPDTVDILAIDMNGIFHNTAQRVFAYGTTTPRLLTKKHIPNEMTQNRILFREICNEIASIVENIRPVKKLLMCVDGVAGLGKMNQQRQRRFRTSIQQNEYHFDPNSFTPGTKLMDQLTKYIDWFIRSMMTRDPLWEKLEVIFSNEKVPGEGEHKIMSYLRKNSEPGMTTIIYGIDADLIMLTLLLGISGIVIARERDGVMEMIAIDELRNGLKNKLSFPGCDDSLLESDFVLLVFLVGNDFLPPIGVFQIATESLDIIVSTYRKEFCEHMTRRVNDRLELDNDAWIRFMTVLGSKEHEFLEIKYNSQNSFFPDPTVIKHLRTHNDRNVLLFDKYKDDYYRVKFGPHYDKSDIVTSYIDGIVWTFHYYKYGMTDWMWSYPYSYAPLLSDIGLYRTLPWINIEEDIFSSPPPFLQLLMILPESSKDLLPKVLQDVFIELKDFFPEMIHIDVTGKRNQWEGVIILPHIVYEPFRRFYDARIATIPLSDQKRNIIGKNFLYKFSPMCRSNFSSFYGNIANCPIYATSFRF